MKTAEREATAERIRRCVEGLDPAVLGLTEMGSVAVTRLHNYLLAISRSEHYPVVQARQVTRQVQALRVGHHNDHHLVEVTAGEEVHRFVLRRNLSPEKEAWRKTRREYAVLRFLNQQGFPYAPRAFYYDDSRQVLGEPFVLMEYVDGQPLHGPPEEWVRGMARMLALLHAYDVPPRLRRWLGEQSLWQHVLSFYRQLCDDFATFCRRSPGDAQQVTFARLLGTVWKRTEEQQDAFEAATRQALIHRRPGGQDILVRPDRRLCLLDWEHCGYGDVAADIGWVFCNHEYDLALRARFWAAYAPDPMDITLPARVTVYEELLHLESALWAANGLAALRLGEASEAVSTEHESLYRTMLARSGRWFAARGDLLPDEMMVNSGGSL